jgi:hypothetical protein
MLIFRVAMTPRSFPGILTIFQGGGVASCGVKELGTGIEALRYVLAAEGVSIKEMPCGAVELEVSGSGSQM